MQNTYYPIELFHWSAMGDKNLYLIEDIINLYPHYINEKNVANETPMFIAAKFNNVKILDFLLQHGLTHINHISYDMNILFVACENNSHDVISLLLNKYHSYINFSFKNNLGKNIFHIAAKKGSFSLFENNEIFKNKKNINLLNEKDKYGQTCLFDYLLGYKEHEDIGILDIILNNLKKDNLKSKNKENMDIFQFAENLFVQWSLNEKNNIVNDLNYQYYKNKYDFVLDIIKNKIK